MAPLRAAPLLTLVLLLAPVGAGFAATLAPAFGYFPALGGDGFSLDPFRALFEAPGLARSAALSLSSGLFATAISLLAALLILAGTAGTRGRAMIERALSPLLAMPHAAAAFGMLFLIAPSGWIARALSPWATGWERPPDIFLVQDPHGLSLGLGLVVKEMPFLFLMALAALPQARERRRLAIARALGYRRLTAWAKAVLPALYPQLRLPIYAVLAFSMSVVDMAMILGPSTPPTLAQRIVDWAADPDLMLRFQAAAGAVLQFALVIAALALWRGGEIIAARLGRAWAEGGARGRVFPETAALGFGLALAALAAILLGGGLLALALWSVAGTWTFPDAFPERLTLATWSGNGPVFAALFAETALIAGGSTLIALALVLACLEAEARFGLTPTSKSLTLLYLPLLLPQVAFLIGLQMAAIAAGFGEGRGAVIFGHLVFVLPYVFLSLAGPWRAWDTRYAATARAMGASPARMLFAVRLPMLLAPLLTAAALGFAVSVAQYLPTLLLGGGRVGTLTTEAVALSSGGDRRLIGLAGLLQTLAAILPFAVAILAPRLVFLNRRGLRHG